MEQDKDILIQKYIDKLLSNEDTLEFEKLLKSDKLLYERYEEYQALYSHIDEREEIKSNLEQIKKQAPGHKENNKLKWIWIPILVLSLATVFFLSFNKKSTKELYASNFDTPVLSVQTKAGNNQGKIIEGMNAYNEGRYEEASTKIKEQYPNLDNTSKLALALTHMRLEKFQLAKLELKELSEIESFRNASHWYLALIYIKEKNNAEAKIQLNKISKESSYFTKSRMLLDELE